MEEKGTLTYSDALALEAELQALGCTSVSFNGTSNMGNDQAAYGESITLNVSVIFPNPLYRNVSAEVKGNGSAYTFDEYGRPVNPDGTLFTMTGLSQNISYIKTYSSVSKW
jgi:hypothetical protein